MDDHQRAGREAHALRDVPLKETCAGWVATCADGVRVALEPDGCRLREVADPAPLPHGHPSPQPFLAPLNETPWRPARRLEPLFGDDAEPATG